MNPITQRCGSGVPGLDDILGGGFPSNCMHLVEGSPGVGKTTLAMQFLLEGKRQGERCLYVTLSETKEELAAVAQSHQWKLDGISIIELSTIERALGGKASPTLFQSSGYSRVSTSSPSNRAKSASKVTSRRPKLRANAAR